MAPRWRRRRAVAFLVLGVLVAALAAAFNVGWIVLNAREGVLLVLGLLLFPLIVAGVALNTIFLVREIRRNEQHNAFINAVTHELKTPVASIRLYLETLQSRQLDDAQRQEFYQIMLVDSDRLLATIEQVLRTGRLGHALRPSEQRRVSFPGLVRDAIQAMANRYSLPPDAIRLDIAPDASEAMVSGDLDELRSAVSNLLDNAVKYSRGPGRDPLIRVQIASGSEKFWTLRVSDNGIGISPPELRAVFKRFYRVPNPNLHVSGTGLGLFIVRSVVRRHGGRVAAESAGLGQGSTFVVHLPRAVA